MRFTQLAPAGTAITFPDLLAWFSRLPRPERAMEELASGIRERYRTKHCFFVSSGRAAMFLIFRCLRALAGSTKTEVIIPSYTCYSVPAAAIRAGLRVRILDIDPETLSYDLDALANTNFDNVLAIVTANLYGIPNDLPAIEAIARRNGVFMLDDAAQCMHATAGGRAVGTFGDVGLFSLDKGKNITSIQGGLIVTSSDTIAAQLRSELAHLPGAAASRTVREAIQLFVYALFLRPSLYWLPASLPFLNLGTTMYTTECPVERYSPWLAPLATRLFKRIDAITAARVATAKQLAGALTGQTAIRLPRPPTDTQPVYLRFPMLTANPAERQRLLHALQARRLGATASYPLATIDIPEIQTHLSAHCANGDAGRALANTVITLPTHHYVTPRYIDEMVSVIRGALR